MLCACTEREGERDTHVSVWGCVYWYPHKERLEPQKLGAFGVSLPRPWKPLVQHTFSDDSASTALRSLQPLL